MTFELTMLAWAAALLFALICFQGALVPLEHGLKWGLGSRNEPKQNSPKLDRARRTLANHIEGMAMFAPLIIIAHLSGISTEQTIWGSGLFLGGRVAFAFFYLLGVPVLRSVAWGVSIVGIIMIFAAIAF